jgi:hypothetical protein
VGLDELCPRGQYCERPEGACTSRRPGVCTKKPEMCPHIYLPVCGCDAKTYANSCEAARAGVTVARKGPCAPRRP